VKNPFKSELSNGILNDRVDDVLLLQHFNYVRTISFDIPVCSEDFKILFTAFQSFFEFFYPGTLQKKPSEYGRRPYFEKCDKKQSGFYYCKGGVKSAQRPPQGFVEYQRAGVKPKKLRICDQVSAGCNLPRGFSGVMQDNMLIRRIRYAVTGKCLPPVGQ
jgi:hypothetical protein